MAASKRGRAGVLWTWALATLLVAGSFAWVLIPALIIQPFKAQTPFGVAVAFELRERAPLVTLLGLVLLLPLVVRLAGSVTRRWQWAPAVLLAALGGGSPGVARQNNFESMFKPRPGAAYAPTTHAGFVLISHLESV